MDTTLNIPLFYALLNVFQSRKNIIRVSILTVLLNQCLCGIRHTELPLNLIKYDSAPIEERNA